MPVRPPQTLQIGTKFREVLPQDMRYEFDQFVASLQQQVGGVGISQHIDLPELTVTASGTGIITLHANAVGYFSQVTYCLIGREQMLLSFYLLSMTVANTPQFIRIRLPLGFTVKYGEYISVPGFLNDNGTVRGTQIVASQGVFPAFVGTDYISVGRNDGVALANSTNNTTVWGQIIFPITRVPVDK